MGIKKTHVSMRVVCASNIGTILGSIDSTITKVYMIVKKEKELSL